MVEWVVDADDDIKPRVGDPTPAGADGCSCVSGAHTPGESMHFCARLRFFLPCRAKLNMPTL